jgi:hypothetical protein
VVRYRQWAGSVSARWHREQLARMRSACEAAWRRRGIAGEFGNRGWLPSSRRQRWSAFLQAGRRGLERGERGMALAYGARALRERPLALEGWRLVALAAGARSRGGAR